MTSDNIIAEAAAGAIAQSADEGTLDKVVVNNDEFTMTRLRSHLMDSSVDADEHTIVYSMIDGTPSTVLKHKLAEVLRKRAPNGGPAFWVPGMPGNPPEPIVGTIMCLLHADHEDREWLNSIGLSAQLCRKANLRSEFDLQNHMLHRHQQEFSLIETARERETQEEQREWTRMQMDAMRQAQSPSSKRKKE